MGDNEGNGEKSDAAASAAAPQSMEPPSSTENSFAAILEAANSIRKEATMSPAPSTPAPHLPSTNAPTLEQLAAELSDGEEPFFGVDDADNEEELISFNEGAAYSADTVKAISALSKGEVPSRQLAAADSSESGEAKFHDKGGVMKPISLQDRTVAMLSVYKEYIQDEEDRLKQYGDQPQDQQPEEESTETGNQADRFGVEKFLREHELRKQEMKLVTLEKFCGNGIDEPGSEYEPDDNDHPRGFIITNEYNEEEVLAVPPKLPTKQELKGPTAATTMAAFRLKAEVALNAASRTAKTTYNDATTSKSDIQQQIAEVGTGEFDYEDYHQRHSTNQEDMEYGDVEQQPQFDEASQSGSEIYGMHILNRDQQLKRKYDKTQQEEMQTFNELCDDLGVTPETHPSLHHFYKPPNSFSRYKYPIFRSKKFRQAVVYGAAAVLVALIALSIVSAVSNGFEDVRKKKSPPLPDWREDWRDQQLMEWEKKHGTVNGGPKVGIGAWSNENGANDSGGGNANDKDNLDKLFLEMSSNYRPVWYDRSTGWLGETYAEAITWCGSHSNFVPCPFEVYCPNDKTLLSGIMDEDGESWAPVINGVNEWVQVGTGGECDLYSNRYGRQPEWGIEGGVEKATRHIMCCRPTSAITGDVSPDAVTGPPPAPASKKGDFATELEIAFNEVAKTYEPVWFARETGWHGSSYQESLDFCNDYSQYIPCPYDAYCPKGMGKLMGGIQDDGESWAAVIDAPNDWVQVGQGGECSLYSESENELPRWGITGEGSHPITRHIMCCHAGAHADVLDASTKISEGVDREEDISGPLLVTLPEPSDSPNQGVSTDASTGESPMTEVEIKIENTYHPMWFTTDEGWGDDSKTSWQDAKQFCESVRRGEGTLHLCPKIAYCPNGPRDSKPLYLQKDGFGGVQWAPIANEQGNSWVMVGNFGGMTCQTYTQINSREPTWGLDGTSSQLKQNILCCEKSEDSPTTIESEQGSAPSSESKAVEPTSEDDIVGSIKMTFDPIWFNAEKGGWKGGSYEDAKVFCQQFAGSHGKVMELCPYAAYCPEGPSKPVLNGHEADFEDEGEQWAPVFGSNVWILISRKNDNSATTCLSHSQLNGSKPEWGLDASRKDNKLHVMCCSPLQ